MKTEPPNVCAVILTEPMRRNAIEFLKRVPLKGEEARALVAVMEALLSAKAPAVSEPSTIEQPSI